MVNHTSDVMVITGGMSP